jgi:hypothetical protein
MAKEISVRKYGNIIRISYFLFFFDTNAIVEAQSIKLFNPLINGATE